jgi:tetratricopeptide (TPR) repeat protein
MKPGKCRYTITLAAFFGILLLKVPEFYCRAADAIKSVPELNCTTSSSEALEQFRIGLFYADAGDYMISRVYFNNAMELDPYFALAFAYHAIGSPTIEEFVSDTRNALIQLHRVNAFEEMLILINETYITGDYNKRFELADRLTQLFPDNARAWVRMGKILQERNATEDARTIFEKARTLAPDWMGPYMLLGDSYSNYEPVDLEKSIEYYVQVEKMYPEVSYVHIQIGNAYRALNNPNKANIEYEQALTENPSDWMAFMMNGRINTLLGNYEEARSDYAIARSYSQDAIQTYTLEALTYIYEGNPDKCLEWLEGKILLIDSLNIEDNRKRSLKYFDATASGWIALHYNKPDHFKLAREIHNETGLEMAEFIESPNIINNIKAENILWEGLEATLSGYYEAAIVKACEIKMLVREDDDPRILADYQFLFGYVMYNQGRYGKAIEYLEEGDPSWLYNKYCLAKAYQANGEPDMATKHFKEVAAYDNNEVEYALIRNEVRDFMASK